MPKTKHPTPSAPATRAAPATPTTPAERSLFRKIMTKIGQYSGAGGIAAAAIDTHDALLDAAVKAAREAEVPEATIQKALALRQRGEKVQDAIAIMFPFLGSPTVIRALGDRGAYQAKPSPGTASKPAKPPTAPKPGRLFEKARSTRARR